MFKRHSPSHQGLPPDVFLLPPGTQHSRAVREPGGLAMRQLLKPGRSRVSLEESMQLPQIRLQRIIAPAVGGDMEADWQHPSKHCLLGAPYAWTSPAVPGWDLPHLPEHALC